MTSTNQIAAFLSDKIYDDVIVNQTFGLPGQVATRFEVVDVSPPNSSGYYGAVIKDTDTGIVSIVSRGTEPMTIQDLSADFNIVIGGPGGDQYTDATSFLDSYNTKVASQGYAAISNAVGHSLGGTLATALGIENGLDIISIGAPGGQSILNDLDQTKVTTYDYTRITDIYSEKDPISGYGTRITGTNAMALNLDPIVEQSVSGWITSQLGGLSNAVGFADEAFITVLTPAGGLVYTLTKEGAEIVAYHAIDNYQEALAGTPVTSAAGEVLGFEIQYEDGNGNTVVKTIYNGDNLEALEAMGVDVEALGDKITVTMDSHGNKVTLLKKDEDVSVDGEDTYLLGDLVDSIQSAGQALSAFLSNQAEKGSEWLTDDTNGIQTAFATWLGANVSDIVDGTLDSEDAFIDLAKFLAADFLAYGTEEIDAIVDFSGANDTIQDVLEFIGVDTADAGALAGGFSQALARMAIDFAFDGFDWDSTQLKNAAVAGITGVVAAHYANKVFPAAEGVDGLSANAGATVAALTTIAVGVANSDEYTQSEWVLLGVNAGVAATSYVAGSLFAETVLATKIAELLGVTTGPVGIVVGALAGIVLSNVVSSFYTGVQFNQGEYPTIHAALASQYVVQEIEVDDGAGGTMMVDALVAVNPEGSVILAEGITHIVGSTGHDTLVGNDPDNVIDGGDGDDYIEGRDGVDALIGGAGGDHMVGNNGDDILDGGDGDDEIFGGAGADTIIGGDGYDFIMGEDGNDTIAAGNDRDIVLAGLGDDVVDAGAGDDLVDVGDGDDVVLLGDGDDLAFGNTGNDILEGQDGEDRLFGEDGNDTLRGGNGRDYLSGGAGIDILSGDAGVDTLLGGFDDDFLDGGLGNDNLDGGQGDDVLEGGLDDDLLIGGLGDDSLSGGAGNDVLIASMGTDTLDGGDGDDIYSINSGDGVNTISADDGGNDRILLNDVASSEITFTEDGDDLLISFGTDEVRVTGQLVSPYIETLELSDGQVDLTALTFPGGVPTYMVDSVSGSAVDTVEDAIVSFVETQAIEEQQLQQHQVLQNISNTSYIEAIRQNPDSVTYNGSEVEMFFKWRGSFFGRKTGKYTAYRIVRDELLETEDVSEVTLLEGVYDPNDYDVINTNAEIVKSSEISLKLGPNVVIKEYVEDLYVDGAYISSTLNQDYLVDGNVRKHYERGLSANQKYSVTDAQALYGTVMLDAEERYTHSERTVYSVTVGENYLTMNNDVVIGTYIGETINGGAGNDILYGGGGQDTLNGQAGEDWLFGNSESDIVNGGLGNDILHGGAVNDDMDGGAGNDGIIGAGGDDTIHGGDGDDWIDGSEGNDVVHGDAGDDSLHGGDDSDLLLGGLGNDFIYGDDGDDELRGDEGADILFGGAGNDLLKGRHDNDTLYGDDGDDYLLGQNGDDELYGGEGNDILDGGNGHDYIDGGAGIDRLSFATFIYAVEADLSTNYFYSTNFGVHNYTIVNIEELEGSDLSDILTGNIGDNVIYGLDGDDTIYGLDGDDTIYGLDGDDIIYAGSGADIIYAGAGHDTVYGEGGDDGLYGEAGNDYLSGEGGHNNLYGGTGDDTLAASYGNEVYDGGDGFDTLSFHRLNIDLNINLTTGIVTNTLGHTTNYQISNIESVVAADGNDSITGSSNVDYLYGEGGSDLILGQSGDDVIYGGAGIDELRGDDGDDILFGGDGNDTLKGRNDNDEVYGESGDDTLYGHNGDDVVSGGDGNDWISGGNGNDTLVGDAGADTFYFHHNAVMSGYTDQIDDFDISESDVIDISNVLDGYYDSSTDTLSDFVQFVDDGADSLLQIDQNGGGNSFTTAARLTDLTGLSADMLETNGYLVTEI